MSKNRIWGPILGSQAHTSSLTARRLASLGSHASVVVSCSYIKITLKLQLLVLYHFNVTWTSCFYITITSKLGLLVWYHFDVT
jgi:hypothetical protein